MNRLDSVRNPKGRALLFGLLSLFLSASFFGLTNASRNIVWFLLVAAVAFCSLWKLPEEWSQLEKWQKGLLVLYGIVFAVTTLLGGNVVVENGNFYSGDWLENYMLPFEKTDPIWCVGMAIFGVSLLLLLKACYLRQSLESTGKKIPQWALWLVIFVAWLPWVIPYYPGMIYWDSSVSINAALSKITSNHHPVLYTLLIRLLLNIGNAIDDYEFGCFLYTLVQMLFLSGAFAYLLRRLQEYGCKRWFILLGAAYFAFTPLMPMHAISMWKDPIYSGLLLLLSIKTVELVISRGEMLKSWKHVLLMALCSVATCFARNNGIWCILLYWICVFLFYGLGKKRIRGIMWKSVVLASLVLYFVVTGPVYRMLGIYSPFKEMITVPLQQMARTVVYKGDIEPQQREFIDELMYGGFEGQYHPCCSDYLKSETYMDIQFLDENKDRFFANWLSIGCNSYRNVKLYVEAYVMQTFELYSIGDVKMNFTPAGGTDFLADDVLERYEIRMRDLSQEWFGSSWRKVMPLNSVFMSTGSLAWLYIGVLTLLFMHSKDKRWCLILFPALCSWVTLLIGVPIVDWRRYVLPFHYVLPLALALPWLCRKWESQHALQEQTDAGTEDSLNQ